MDHPLDRIDWEDDDFIEEFSQLIMAQPIASIIEIVLEGDRMGRTIERLRLPAELVIIFRTYVAMFKLTIGDNSLVWTIQEGFEEGARGFHGINFIIMHRTDRTDRDNWETFVEATDPCVGQVVEFITTLFRCSPIILDLDLQCLHFATGVRIARQFELYQLHLSSTQEVNHVRLNRILNEAQHLSGLYIEQIELHNFIPEMEFNAETVHVQGNAEWFNNLAFGSPQTRYYYLGRTGLTNADLNLYLDGWRFDFFPRLCVLSTIHNGTLDHNEIVQNLPSERVQRDIMTLNEDYRNRIPANFNNRHDFMDDDRKNYMSVISNETELMFLVWPPVEEEEDDEEEDEEVEEDEDDDEELDEDDDDRSFEPLSDMSWTDYEFGNGQGGDDEEEEEDEEAEAEKEEKQEQEQEEAESEDNAEVMDTD